MKIQIAQFAGFCQGVERAYKIALETKENNKNIPVYVLGYLVHNSFVIQKLESLCIKKIDSLDEIEENENCIVIISAHGVGPDIFERAKEKCVKVIDTTCPWVKNAHEFARDLSKKGYSIIIVGDKNHTEVKGIAKWVVDQDNVIVLENASSLNDIKDIESSKIAIIAQTTQAEENFEEVVNAVKVKFPQKEIVVRNTICGATQRRQSCAIKLAKDSDIMIIIGDKKSANTKRLKELCEKTGVLTFQISSKEDLDKNWFVGKERVGITAGASTPEYIISEVVDAIQS